MLVQLRGNAGADDLLFISRGGRSIAAAWARSCDKRRTLLG